MLVIRLSRVGKKNQPSFQIVLNDKRKSAKAGRFMEILGFLNPLKDEKNLKAERIKYWLSVGAKPSATVHNLLVRENIIFAKKIAKNKKSKKELPASDPTGQAKKEPAAVGPTGQAKKAEETALPAVAEPAMPPAVPLAPVAAPAMPAVQPVEAPETKPEEAKPESAAKPEESATERQAEA